jgi:hypothetical protein
VLSGDATNTNFNSLVWRGRARTHDLPHSRWAGYLHYTTDGVTKVRNHESIRIQSHSLCLFAFTIRLLKITDKFEKHNSCLYRVNTSATESNANKLCKNKPSVDHIRLYDFSNIPILSCHNITEILLKVALNTLTLFFFCGSEIKDGHHHKTMFNINFFWWKCVQNLLYNIWRHIYIICSNDGFI